MRFNFFELAKSKLGFLNWLNLWIWKLILQKKCLFSVSDSLQLLLS